MISATLETALTTSMISTYFSLGTNPGLNSSISAFLPASRGSFCITPGRTVAICGRNSGQAMVAMVFPPNAGRVIRSWLCFCSLPGVGTSGKSPISSCVQSAVRPVWMRAQTRGPRSRPMAVAPIRNTSGLYFSITDARAWV